MTRKKAEKKTEKKREKMRSAKHHSIGKDHKKHAGVEGDYEPHHAVKDHKPRR